jgi:hypothetical protein
MGVTFPRDGFVDFSSTAASALARAALAVAVLAASRATSAP